MLVSQSVIQTYARLPSYCKQKAEIVSKHGVILRCTVSSDGLDTTTIDSIDKGLRGLRYGFVGQPPKRERDCDNQQALRQNAVWDWIREESAS